MAKANIYYAHALAKHFNKHYSDRGFNEPWSTELKSLSSKSVFDILLHGHYQVFDTYGVHEGWIHFTAKISRVMPMEFVLVVKGAHSQRLSAKYELRDYIRSCIFDALNKKDCPK